MGAVEPERGSDGGTEQQVKKPTSRSPTFTKVIVRRLPPTMNGSELLDQMAPLPDYDYFYFTPADMSLSPWAFSRAYFNFACIEDVILFRDRFDGYVFLDNRGNEYPAMVELAPFQKVPLKKSKKDPKINTYEKDPDYKAFLENINNPKPIELPSLSATLAEIEQRDKELKENKGLRKIKTPLIEFVELRKEERRVRREEKRRLKEERLKRELEEKRRRIERERERAKKEKEAKQHAEAEKGQEKPIGKTPKKATKQILDKPKARDRRQSSTTENEVPVKDKAKPKLKSNLVVEGRQPKGAIHSSKAAQKNESMSKHDSGDVLNTNDFPSIVNDHPKSDSANQAGTSYADRAKKDKVDRPKEENNSSVNSFPDKPVKEAKPERQTEKVSKPKRYKDKPSMPLYQPAQHRKKQLEATEKPLVFKDDDE